MKGNLLSLVICLCASLGHAQGFAGLGTDVEGFSIPERGNALTFPSDHLAHPDYRIEWWYLTANLLGEDNKDYGVQWTLFRSALEPEERAGWNSPQLWMGHAALTTPSRHYFSERIARGGIGQAGVKSGPFEAWIDDWTLLSGDDSFDQVQLRARGTDFAYDLSLSAQGPLVLHGDAGFSVKSPSGQASYYYSQPFYTVSGTINTPDGPVEVTGQAWLDREWSSQPLSEDQSGWDWFSLSFDTGDKMMAFRLRGSDIFTSGTWITADGQATSIPDGAVMPSPLNSARVAGRDVPVTWRLHYPDRNVDVTITAQNPQSWMGTTVEYWEGPVRVTGSHTGVGYLEMTGYE